MSCSTRCLVLTAGLVLAVGPQRVATAAEPGADALGRYLIPHLNRERLRDIGREFSIEGGTPDGMYLYVYARASRSDKLMRLAPEASLVTADVDAWMRDLSPFGSPGYLDYDEYEALFEQYQASHPDFVEFHKVDWLKSQDGLPIHILKVTGNISEPNPDKPNIVFTGSTHGDEWSSTAVPMGILKQLIEGYGTDPRLTKLVDWSVTYWMPSMSPDSFHQTREVHGVDPNRIYPYPGHDTDGSIDSARNLMRWYDEIQPAGVIDFHGIQGSIVYSWGYTEDRIADTEDYNRFASVAEAMAVPSGYMHGQIPELFYIAEGNSIDAWYYLHGTLSYTIEVGGSSYKPPPSELPGLINENTGSVWLFIEELLPDEDPGGDDTGDTGESGTGDDGEADGEADGDEVDGCGCSTAPSIPGSAAFLALAALGIGDRRRRREA